jgi:N-formylglutamate deformylase
VIDTFTFHEGDLPLLISVPHDGRQIPCEIAGQMTDTGRSIPDTDWHVARLYEFARDIGAWMIRAEYSRYVVDLNRPADGAALYAGRFGTGLCPTETFGGQDIYVSGASIDIEDRVEAFWHPYHDKLAQALVEIRDRFGLALLWDAHSITSRVPRLFDGELPVLNVGTFDERSCAQGAAQAVMSVADDSPFDAVYNGRFKGGYITRHYGRPADNVHAIQLELAQRSYMNEVTCEYENAKASILRDTLARMLAAFVDAAHL